MIEIKYLKQLPCRSSNKNNACIVLRGADLYVDKDGNRFAYVALTNNFKSPFFSLYMYIKEYDAAGTLIKEDKYSNPAAYGKTGMYITKEPIPVEKECDAIEVYISYVEYLNHVFYHDRFSKSSDIRADDKFNDIPTFAANPTPANVETTKPVFEEAREEVNPVPASNDHANKAYTASLNVKNKVKLPFFIPLLVTVIAIVVMYVCLFQGYKVITDPNFSKAFREGNESAYYPFLFLKTLLTTLFR